MKVYLKQKKLQWLSEKDKRVSDRLIESFSLRDPRDLSSEAINLKIFKSRGNTPYACHIVVRVTHPEVIALEGKARGETVHEALVKTLAISFVFEPKFDISDASLSQYSKIRAVMEAIATETGIVNGTAVHHG